MISRRCESALILQSLVQEMAFSEICENDHIKTEDIRAAILYAEQILEGETDDDIPLAVVKYFRKRTHEKVASIIEEKRGRKGEHFDERNRDLELKINQAGFGLPGIPEAKKDSFLSASFATLLECKPIY